jgi:hypothetical protein
MAVSAQRKPEFPVPDSIHVFRIANVIQTVTEIDSKTTKKTMPYVITLMKKGFILLMNTIR